MSEPRVEEMLAGKDMPLRDLFLAFEAANHSTIPRTAPPRQKLSSFVQHGVPYFRASTATTHAPRTAPRIWPLTVSLKNIPARVIVSKLAQMNHDAFAGFVSFRRMARI